MTNSSQERVKIPFDIETEMMFCGRCGKRCVPQGHLMMQFLLCPDHGEFTIAPVVMFDGKDATFNPEGTDKWYIQCDQTVASMWDTCKFVDAIPGGQEPGSNVTG